MSIDNLIRVAKTGYGVYRAATKPLDDFMADSMPGGHCKGPLDAIRDSRGTLHDYDDTKPSDILGMIADCANEIATGKPAPKREARKATSENIVEDEKHGRSKRPGSKRANRANRAKRPNKANRADNPNRPNRAKKGEGRKASGKATAKDKTVGPAARRRAASKPAGKRRDDLDLKALGSAILGAWMDRRKGDR